MTGKTSVTVIVPAYNAAPFVDVTLKALLSQTQVPEEIILVDDGSTDETAAIAEGLGVRVVHQKRKGPGAARNRGLELAKTEFVAFCDADDWYVPDKLERAVEMLNTLGASCASTDAWVVRDDRVERRKNEPQPIPNVLTLEYLLVSNPIICSTVVARRATVEDAGGFDEAEDLIASEDYDLWLRLAAKEPIAYSSRPMTFYRLHDGSLSANVRFMRGLERILDRVSSQHEGEVHFQNLIKRRRAGVRLDLA